MHIVCDGDGIVKKDPDRALELRAITRVNFVMEGMKMLPLKRLIHPIN
jgi:hypothetical protein